MRIAFWVFITFFMQLKARGEFPRPEMRLWTDSFISENYAATIDKNFNFVGVRLDNMTDPESKLKADVRAGFAVDAPILNFFNISELYYQRDNFSFGRKKSSWSELDSRWNLAVWEPVFRWNPLIPESQGLTGAFYTLATQNWEWETMASPFFIPEQGPNFSFNPQGELEPLSPWFSQPPTAIRITAEGETTPISYNISKPKVSDVVFQYNLSTRLRYQEKGFSGQVSYAVKPMNQLPLAYYGNNDIAGDQAPVEIITSIQYHELAGLDLYFKNEAVTIGLSALHDHPLNEAKFQDSDKWTRPIYQDASLLSPYLDFRFSKGFEVRLQHLQISGGDIAEVGPRASADRLAFSKRYPYREAESIGLSYQGRNMFGTPWQTQLSYTVSQKNKFDILRWGGQISWNRQWTAFSEVLLVRAEASSMTNPSDIGEFDNHDRVLVGVGYVF